MGVEHSLQLSINEINQMKSMLASLPPGSKRASYIKIIMGVASCKEKKEVAVDIGVSRKTVWKVVRRFNIFGLEGILNDAPRTGRKRTIHGERIEEILTFPLHNDPEESACWTGTELAHRMDLPLSTLYRFLNEWGVKVDDSRTLHEACAKDIPDTSDIGGLFLSPSVSIIAFISEGGGFPSHAGAIIYTTSHPKENVSSFLRRTSSSVLGLLEDARASLLLGCERASDSIDVLIFLRIIAKQIARRKGVLLTTGSEETIAFKRIAWFVTNHPRLHLVVSRGEWSEMLKKELLQLGETSKMTVALRLEDLETCLREWVNMPKHKHSIFVWIAPSK